MDAPIPEPERYRLLSAWCDGSLSEAEVDQLDALLRNEPEFRKLYLAYMDLHAILNAGVFTTQDPLPVEPRLGWAEGERDRGAGRRDAGGALGAGIGRGPLRSARLVRGRWWGWVAAAVLLAWVAVRPWPRGPQAPEAPPVAAPSPPVTPTTALDGLAMVIKLEGVRWGMPNPPAVEGSVLKSRRLRLQSGRATLALFNGVVLTLEGPADVDLISVDRVYCHRGKLRARVPKGAEGFVVITERTAVVDLGTEFGLNVDADGMAQIRVFEGKAEAALLDGEGAPRRLQLVERSKAFAINPRAGQIAELGAGPVEFVPSPMLAGSTLELDPGYAGAVLRSRPRGYWRFESMADGAVPNEVPGGPPLRAGGPVALVRSPGGNGSARFQAGEPGQFLTTDGLWEFDREPGIAFELWCRPEDFRYASLMGLYPPRESNPSGQAHWFLHTFFVEITGRGRQELHKPASIRIMHRWPLDVRVAYILFSERYYFPQRWHHIVAQKKGDRMEFYFDGVPDRSMQIDPDYPSLPCHLVVGRRTPEVNNPEDSRSFVGQLDEIALYSHTLSPEEIWNHYKLATRTGLPE